MKKTKWKFSKFLTKTEKNVKLATALVLTLIGFVTTLAVLMNKAYPYFEDLKKLF